MKFLQLLSILLVFISQVHSQSTENQDRVKKGIDWLLSRRLPNKGWDNQNTGRAILALQATKVGNQRWSEYGGTEYKISVKQLEVEVLAALAQENSMSHFDDATLLSYLGALVATCNDLKDFHGHDLGRVLENRMDGFSNLLQYSLGVVTLCSSGQRVQDSHIGTMLTQLRNIDGRDCVFCDEIASSVLLALSCAREQRTNSNDIIDRAIARTSERVKKSQRQDGGFGNTYATALAIQALDASNTNDPQDKTAMHEYLYREQKKDTGSFVNVFISTVVLPAIGENTYLAIGRTDCPPKGVLVPDVGPDMIFVRYRVEDGIQNAFNISGSVAVPQGTTAHQIMNSLASESPGSFQYKSENLQGRFAQNVIVELNGLKSNPQRRLFWNVYTQNENNRPQRSQSGSAVVLKNNELIIFRFERL